MKYLLLLHGDESAFDAVSEEEQARVAEELFAFDKRYSSVILDSNPLAEATQARTVRFADGASTLTDGPLTEAKEVVGGFIVVDVPSIDDAVAIAREWPAGRIGRGAVEVRAMLEMCPVMAEHQQ